jgi:hypothetical protein
MSAKTQITGEFAKPRDVASHLGIPAARAAELRLLLVEINGPKKTSARTVAKNHPSSTRSKKK